MIVFWTYLLLDKEHFHFSDRLVQDDTSPIHLTALSTVEDLQLGG